MNSKITYNITEAAKALGVSRNTMYSLLCIDGFPVFRIGKRVLIPKASLEEWVTKQAETACAFQCKR